eukprot:TCONS_00033796-protein
MALILCLFLLSSITDLALAKIHVIPVTNENDQSNCSSLPKPYRVFEKMLDSDVIQDGDTIHFECNAMDHFFVPDTLKIKQKSLTIKMVNHQDTKQALNTITGLDCLNNKPLVEFIGNKSTDHREIKFIGIRFDNVTLFQNISHNVKLNFENCVFTGSRNLF